MCTYSCVNMILHVSLHNKKSRNGWSAYRGPFKSDKHGGDNMWQSYSIYHSTEMTGHWINLNTSAFDFPNRRSFPRTSHPLRPQLRAIFSTYPEPTEQQHGCPGRKWWRNRPTWKEPAAPDKCLLQSNPGDFCCLSKVWVIKKMPMPVMLAKIWMMHDVSTRTLTQTIENMVSIYTSITSCMCEWKLDGVWKAPYQHKQLSYVPLRIAGQTAYACAANQHASTIACDLVVCFRPNRICTSVFIQNLHLIY